MTKALSEVLGFVRNELSDGCLHVAPSPLCLSVFYWHHRRPMFKVRRFVQDLTYRERKEISCLPVYVCAKRGCNYHFYLFGEFGGVQTMIKPGLVNPKRD